MEGTTVLPGHPHIPAGLEQLVQGFTLLGAPVGAVQKEHIGALGLGYLDPIEVAGDVIAGVVYVSGEYLAQLVQPPLLVSELFMFLVSP